MNRSAKLFVPLLVVGALTTSTAFADIVPCNLGVTTIAEGLVEASTTMTCAGFTFGASAGVTVLMDPGLLPVPSDIITLSDVALPTGELAANITFVSDLDL